MDVAQSSSSVPVSCGVLLKATENWNGALRQELQQVLAERLAPVLGYPVVDLETNQFARGDIAIEPFGPLHRLELVFGPHNSSVSAVTSVGFTSVV